VNTISISACAKINLGLLLLRQRDDGYTDIATVFQEISLADQLHFRRIDAHGIRLVCDQPGIPVNSDNLIWKAYTLFQQQSGVDWGIDVRLEKRIPAGGGLGGGSSDAAATLTALNRLAGHVLSEADLFELAQKLGSDVPFFLHGGTALGEGRGEILTPIDMDARYFIVLILPGIHVSTAWAYQASRIALTKNKKISTFRALFRDLHLKDWRGSLVNEMEAAVFQRHSRLLALKDSLYDAGAGYASMSGSGSTLFGLFFEEQAAEVAAANIEQLHAVNTVICRPFSRKVI